MAFITGIPIRNSIHTDFSRESGVWANYRTELTGDYIDQNGNGTNFHEFADGSFREYNRKLNDLNINGSESIFLEPYDAGFRYKGDPLVARFPSGIACGFSCRNIGFGGPIVRARRSTDNTEVDVRGDNDGVLSLNSPIIDYRENLVTQSETFSSWSNVNITLTAGQVDAFGGTNASIFTPDGTGTDRREILTTVVANQTYNGSVFVKAGTSDNFQVQFVDHLAGYASRGLLKVDVAADGSFSTATATSISNVTYTASSNGFTRVSFSFTPSASSTQLSMRLFPDRDNGTGTTIFFGAQLSNGETVEKYIKTSGSTISELDRPQETLGEYIGTGHAYVTNWYDQSATGSDQKNFEQATASYQPLVVESGAIITGGNGKAGVRWDVGKSMYISSQFSGSTLDAFFVSDMDVTTAIESKKRNFIILNGAGTGGISNNNYLIAQSGSTSTSIGSLGNANKTLRVNGVDYDPNDPELTRNGVFEHLSHNKLYSVVGGSNPNYTGTHDNILNLGFYTSSPTTSYNFEGLMQETILYTGDQLSTRTGIETEMNNHYNMF
jgi:hypothetical protein